MQQYSKESPRDGAVWVADSPVLAGASQGPLAAERLAVKDLFDIEGFTTGYGNPDWLSSHAPATHTAEAVKALLAAGASLVGKTQTDELAYSLNGANVHYGTPVNPAAPERLPGGSSSGSAVAVASGQADIGLGTDTGGSIRIPSSYCGLYGLRPSWGAISLKGACALAPGFDTAGLMCREPVLLRRAAEVLLPPQAPRRFERAIMLLPDGVDMSRAQGVMADRLAAMGLMTATQRLSDARMAHASEAFRLLQGRQIWRTHGQWITTTRPRVASDIQQRLDWCATLTDADEARAQLLAEDTVAWLQGLVSDGSTLLCLPSAPGAAPLLNIAAVELAAYRNRLMGMTALAGLWQAPVVALPWLTQHNAPWGVSLLAPPGCDRALLEVMAP